MIQSALLSENRPLLFLFLLLVCTVAVGQRKPKNQLESFLDTQFWLGLRMGINATEAVPESRHSGLSPIDYSLDSLNKEYSNFRLPGASMGLEMNFYHKGFSVSFQPSYKVNKFSYSSQFLWLGAQPSSRFETEYSTEQKLDVLELPLMLKRDLKLKGKVRPFVMFGGCYSIVTAAQKTVKTTQTDYSSGTALTTTISAITLGGKEAFQNFSGIAGGAGVNLDYWNIRTVFEVGYSRSLTPVTVPGAREERLASIGEVNDDLKLNNLNISLSLVFPFRFIDQQFRAY